MKALFEDQTQQETKWDHPFYVIFSALVLAFYCAGFLAGLDWFRLAIERREEIGYLIHPIVLALGGWVISQSYWITFSFPKRVHAIFRAEDGSLIVARDYPCKPVTIPAGAVVSYALSWGNFRLDLVQRGNAPHGLNIWFSHEGYQFWISESSSNYREALYLLAEHAILVQDTKLRRWERYVFWYRWRGHFKQRPQLQEIIDEVHRILKREQAKPASAPEIPEVMLPVTPVAADEARDDSRRPHEVPEQPAALLIKSPDEEPREFGNARMEIKGGQATLTIKRKSAT